MKILNITDKAFQTYENVVKGLDVSDLLETLKNTPQFDDVIYIWRLTRNWKIVNVQRLLYTAYLEVCRFKLATAMEATIY